MTWIIIHVSRKHTHTRAHARTHARTHNTVEGDEDRKCQNKVRYVRAPLRGPRYSGGRFKSSVGEREILGMHGVSMGNIRETGQVRRWR